MLPPRRYQRQAASLKAIKKALKAQNQQDENEEELLKLLKTQKRCRSLLKKNKKQLKRGQWKKPRKVTPYVTHSDVESSTSYSSTSSSSSISSGSESSSCSEESDLELIQPIQLDVLTSDVLDWSSPVAQQLYKLQRKNLKVNALCHMVKVLKNKPSNELHQIKKLNKTLLHKITKRIIKHLENPHPEKDQLVLDALSVKQSLLESIAKTHKKLVFEKKQLPLVQQQQDSQVDIIQQLKKLQKVNLKVHSQLQILQQLYPELISKVQPLGQTNKVIRKKLVKRIVKILVNHRPIKDQNKLDLLIQQQESLLEALEQKQLLRKVALKHDYDYLKRKISTIKENSSKQAEQQNIFFL